VVYGGNIGYHGYVIGLLLISGILTVVIDAKKYRASGMEKETRAARFIGWLNISLALASLAFSQIYNLLMS
jgi:hypothetical protein